VSQAGRQPASQRPPRSDHDQGIRRGRDHFGDGARRKTVYVVNTGVTNGTVTPISTATNRTGRPIGVGIMPDFIAITPNGLTAYVANLDSNTVTPISTVTNRAGRAIRVGSHPDDIAITP
jgi:hyaluronoglucosaminidase